MGHRRGAVVAFALVALTLVAGCGPSKIAGSPGPVGSGGGGSGPDAAEVREMKVESPDEILEVVQKGAITYRRTRGSRTTTYLSYGFVLENVSDKVALTVRVVADFLDEAGNVVEDARGSEDFTVILPGQRVGSGDTSTYGGEDLKEMRVKVILIGGLDTPNGELHRKPPAPYVELKTANPVTGTHEDSSGKRESVKIDVTNTYDVPVRPRPTAVIWDSAGKIVGGMSHNAMEEELQPGASGQASIGIREISLDRLATGVRFEYYADPQLGWIVTTEPVFQELN